MARKKRITKRVLFAKTVEIMQPMLKLDQWKISVRFTKRLAKRTAKDKDKDTVAQCTALPEYKEAVIRVHLDKIADLSYYEIVSMAIHECCHCIVWPLGDWAEHLCRGNTDKMKATETLEEGVVTSLERILTDLAADIIQEELSEQGYSNLDLIFKEFVVEHTT